MSRCIKDRKALQRERQFDYILAFLNKHSEECEPFSLVENKACNEYMRQKDLKTLHNENREFMASITETAMFATNCGVGKVAFIFKGFFTRSECLSGVSQVESRSVSVGQVRVSEGGSSQVQSVRETESA